MLGDAGVGKTSILNRFIEDNFSANYEPTIAVDYKSIKPESSKKNI